MIIGGIMLQASVTLNDKSSKCPFSIPSHTFSKIMTRIYGIDLLYNMLQPLEGMQGLPTFQRELSSFPLKKSM